MKVLKKILLVLLLTILIINSFNIVTNVKAGISDPNYYNPGGLTDPDTSRVTKITGDILATIRNIGIIISVVVLSIIGFKYILGSLEEKANYKENAIPYIIGCFVLGMATTIPSIVYELVN